MDEQFRFFASSHLYLGVELAAGLLIMYFYTKAGQYFGRTWSLWLAASAFIASPFWFNPLSFQWDVVVSDYKSYLDWMGGTTGGATKCWSQWWDEENSYYKKMVAPSKIVFVVKSILYVLVANGIRQSSLLESNPILNKPWINVTFLTVTILILVALMAVYRSAKGQLPYAARQTVGIMIFLGISLGSLVLFLEDSDFIRYTLAAYYGIGALCQLGLLFGVKAVKGFYFVHDLLCGHIIFVFLFLLAGLKLPNTIQTWLLYNNALSTDVVVSDILRYAQKSQKSSSPDQDLLEQIAELKKQIQKQEALLVAKGSVGEESSTINAFNTLKRNESTDAIAELVSPYSEEESLQIRRPAAVTGSAPGGGLGGRAVSLSRLDVWGPMTMGDQSDGNDNGFASYQNTEYQTATKEQSSSSQGFTFSQPDQMPPR